jgi:hypothetical protein
MLRIKFYPEYDNEDFKNSAKEYQLIWDDEGLKITETIERISGLTFIETEINALIFEGVSRSHPLQLRASNSLDEKRATIVHELCHRICFGNKVRIVNNDEPRLLTAHKTIFLILYDVLVDLYGEESALKNVEHESKLSDEYKQAWEWALKKTPEKRLQLFGELKQ